MSAPDPFAAWRDAVNQMARSMTQGPDMARQLATAMESQTVLFRDAVTQQRRVVEQAFEPADAFLEVLDGAAAPLRGQAEAFGEAARAFGQAAEVLSRQADLVEQSARSLRAQTSAAKAAFGLAPREP